MKTHAVRIHETGAPSVMRWEELDLPEPSRGEVLSHHTVIGLNFIDIYYRSGVYPVRTLPTGLGVEAVGPDVVGFKLGQRVGYTGGGRMDAYTEARIRETDGLYKLPVWLDDKAAAAALSKGMTVEYLFNRTHKVRIGETILFHAAAGVVTRPVESRSISFSVSGIRGREGSR